VIENWGKNYRIRVRNPARGIASDYFPGFNFNSAMKISRLAFAVLAVGITGVCAQIPSAGTSQATIPPPMDYQVVQQDANSRVWQREGYEQGPNGEVITNIQKYMELATGLNHLVGSQWVASLEKIDPQPDGTAAATNGLFQAFFPSDILNGEIELVTPGGKQLKSQPIGLSYDDGSNSVLIAVLTNSIGQIINANQVIYTNAFVGLNADLLCTYRKSGFEQDIVLREQPPTPESLNLNPVTAKIEVLTEFFNGLPQLRFGQLERSV
jgi:hypothetical protein